MKEGEKLRKHKSKVSASTCHLERAITAARLLAHVPEFHLSSGTVRVQNGDGWERFSLRKQAPYPGFVFIRTGKRRLLSQARYEPPL